MNKAFHLLVLFIIGLGVILFPPATPPSHLDWQAQVDPWVLETAQTGETEFIIFLSEQADLSRAAFERLADPDRGLLAVTVQD